MVATSGDMVATSGDITRCRFPGFQVSYEPKATWKPRKHRKPGNLGNQETWKPGKRFPSWHSVAIGKSTPSMDCGNG